MLETTGILNEEILKELSKYAMPSKRKNMLRIYSIVCVGLGVLEIILGIFYSRNKSILFGIGFLCFSIIAIGLIIYSEKKFVELNIKILDECVHERELKTKVIFEEDGVIVNNSTTYSTIKIKYDNFIRIVETSSVYFLVTEANLYAIVDKKCLNNEQLDILKKIIKDKCKNIK